MNPPRISMSAINGRGRELRHTICQYGSIPWLQQNGRMSRFELIECEICDKSEKDKQTSDIEAIEMRKYVTCGAAGLVTRYVITIHCDQMVEPRLQSEQAENNIFRAMLLKAVSQFYISLLSFLCPA